MVTEDGHVARTAAFLCLSAGHTLLPATVPRTPLKHHSHPNHGWWPVDTSTEDRASFQVSPEALPTPRRCQSTAHSHQAPGGGLWPSILAASDACMVSAGLGEREALRFPPALAALRESGPRTPTPP